jgi:hypothetical protein
VARGQKARDPQGFAAEYARLAAVALGSKTVRPPLRRLPVSSARQDAFTWFPDSVKIVAAQDFRTDEPLSFEAGKGLRQLMLGGIFVPPQFQEELYKAAEMVGNVRIDRFAIGFTPDPQGGAASGKIYMRFTGKGDPRRLLAAFRQNNPGLVTKEVKGFRGQRVTTVQFGNNREPGMALVGDSDVIIAGYEGRQQPNVMELVDQVLAVRAGRQKNALSGPLGKLLQKLSPRASAVAAGELPNEMRNGLMQPPGFSVFPTTVLAELVRDKRGARLRWEGKLDNADDAKAFVADVDRLKKMGLEGLKTARQNMPPGLPVPPGTFKMMTKVLESVKAQAKGPEVHGSMTIPAEAFKLLTNLGAVGVVGGAAAPPAKAKAVEEAPKPAKKGETKKAPPPEKGSALRAPGRDLARARPALTRPRPAIACLHEYAARG